MQLTNARLLASICGVSAHVLVFRVGEWDLASPSIFVFHALLVVTALFASRVQLLGLSVSELMTCLGYYVAGLYASMMMYRAYLHRLCKYPGPVLASLTNFYITARSVSKFQLFKEVQKLHLQYGDYVRLGPSELSIADPKAVEAIYGSKSPTTKGPWYTLLEPRTPVFMVRDKREHARRRKTWDLAFTTKALHGYDFRITKAITELLQVVDRHQEQPINMTTWFSFFAFDVMEDLAFNKTSHMLRHGRESYIFKTMRGDMYSIAFFSHLPWLMPFLKRTPVLNSNYLKFWRWIQNQIDERIKNTPDWPDIFSFLLADFNRGSKTQQERWDLHGDAQLIVIAGSESVSTTITHVFFHLAHDAHLAHALQRELDMLPGLAHDNLLKIPLLDAVIHETMRLHPAVPSGTQRVTPPEGLTIGERHIPGNTIVQVPSYTVFRDARCFVQPNDFIPERWTTRPDLILDKSVFIPFNIGTSACVGKRLALMEIRRVVAELFWRYDVGIAPGHTKEAFLEGKQDTFTLMSPPLPLVFTPRSR
ncbi:uncharacterized protein G6M90_00g011610 [Metarhizium brunneum]|uniref:Cytochrome P450 n=1 Tax=Metarhizium brunneum TaxID=500148 RepID=A0A7D5UPR7_9HYPO